MAAHSFLKFVAVDDLTPAQRRTLNKQLRKQRQEIKAALKLVESNLARLAKAQARSRKKY